MSRIVASHIPRICEGCRLACPLWIVIQAPRIRNVRWLKNARVDFQIENFNARGDNNSGAKPRLLARWVSSEATRAGDQLFTNFSAETWQAVNAFGDEEPNAELPSISMDLWLAVGKNDLTPSQADIWMMNANLHARGSGYFGGGTRLLKSTSDAAAR